MRERRHNTNLLIWAICSAAILCLFLAFEPGIGIKASPIREDWLRQGASSRLSLVLKAALLFAMPSTILGWVLHAIGIAAWSKISG
jgi:hypothetical protein